MYRMSLLDLMHLADPSTDRRLLPPHLRGSDNAGRQSLTREALRFAMEECLSAEQREVLHRRYWQRKSLREIGADMGVTAPTVNKWIKASIQILRDRIHFFLRLYDALSRRRENAADCCGD